MNYEEYAAMRDMVTGYTDGNLLVTSWRWNTGDVKPGESVGLCVGDPENEGNYWSCWEFTMSDDGMYSDMPTSYLIKPSEFNKDSRLNKFEPLPTDAFPAMYGGWICYPPEDIMMNSMTDCLRFLPSESYTSYKDFRYASPMKLKVMTYLSSRGDGNTTIVEGNETMTEEGRSAFEEFTIDLMGAWSGISAAGLALASAIALFAF